MAFGYFRALVVQSGQVPSTQTDFPVLVSVTHADLKSTANGGHVQSASGFDIRPYSNPGLSSTLTYELEFYDAVNGILVMWVKIASLSSGSVFYLAYGDSGITTDGSSASTWDSNYKWVAHLGDGTTLSAKDSVSGNSGTITAATATAGQVDGGASFNGTSAQINVGHPAALNFAGTKLATVEAWIKRATATSSGGIFNNRDSGWTFSLNVAPAGAGQMKMSKYAVADITVGTVPQDTSWHHIVGVWDSAEQRVYIDGAVTSGVGTNSANFLAGAGEDSRIGFDNVDTDYFDGLIDELRVSNSVRSADWITTAFNNQNAPGTFLVMGTETPIGGARRSHFLTMFPV